MAKETTEATKSESIKFLCSYGGKILPRRSDGKLRYVGGYTRVLSVDRAVSYSELMAKLVEFCGFSVTLKCQLPNGDLDTLISVKSDEDLANVIEEYDGASSPSSPHKIRAVLASPNPLKKVYPPLSSSSSVGSSLDKSPISGDGSPRQAIGSHRSSLPTFSFPANSRCINRSHYVHRAPRVLCTAPCCNYFVRVPERRRQQTN